MRWLIAAALVLSLTACGSTKPWADVTPVPALNSGAGTCASAMSPDQTEQRTICKTLNGPYTCVDGTDPSRDPPGFFSDPNCKAALKAIEASGALT